MRFPPLHLVYRCREPPSCKRSVARYAPDMPPLAPCATCARHVKSAETTCPFCGAEVPSAEAPAGLVTTQRLSRAALFAAGAAGLLVAAGDCSAPPAPEPPYGGVPVIDAAPFATSGSFTGDSGTTDAAADAGATLDGADGGR